MSRRQGAVKEEKKEYEDKMSDFLQNYKRILFCTFENVRSQQIHNIRRDLRGKAVLCMGKKTLQRKIVANRSSSDSATDIDSALHERSERLGLLRGMTGLVFTNCEYDVILKVLQTHRIQAPARVGAIAPVDVVIPAGNTGMEPTQTSFFQALGIPTKITKGTVEIISDKKVLSVGDKVDNSTATLLQKLKISPFYYAMEVKYVWDRGVVFTPADLSITDAELETAMVEGISNLAALAAGSGIPTPSLFGAVAVDAFKNLLAASIASSYTFTEFNGQKIRADALEGKLAAAAPAPAAAAAAAPASKAAAPAAPAKQEAPPAEEEEDDFGMGGLF